MLFKLHLDPGLTILDDKKCIKTVLWFWSNRLISTVGENIIATTKIRNNYGAIKSLIFFKFAIAILDFSLLLLVKLSLLILFVSFLVSVNWFFFDGSLSKVIALSRS